MSKARRSGGSWRDRQERDPFVIRARRDGWRARAVYKLEEICARESILRPGMICIDLGAAPGSWSQFVSARLNGRGRLLAVDLLAMSTLPDVTFIRGDFTEDEILRRIRDWLGGEKAHLVMSDMAPNISGNKVIDQPRAMYLAELALDMAAEVLRPGGDFVCKLFQGSGTDDFIVTARGYFERVRVMKPKASRPGSSEVYLVARNHQL